MKTRLLCIVVLVALGVSPLIMADENRAELAEIANMVREGDIDVGKQYSMHHKDGRFHKIHSEIVGMECTNCHQGKSFKKDYLYASKDKPLHKKAKGRVNRSICLGCHQEGGVATGFYPGATQ